MLAYLSTKLFLIAHFGDPCKVPQNKYPFFGFPHWWQYINQGERDVFDNCVPKLHFPNDLYAIGFAILNMLLYAAGIVAVAMIIVAGVSYINSGGNVENATNARRRIVNTLIGLVIVVVAASVVTFIGNTFIK